MTDAIKIKNSKTCDTSHLPLKVAHLTDVRAGQAMPFARGQTSAINKSPVEEVVAVNFMGLATDEQADRRHHGGPFKAVHQMSPNTYSEINKAFDLNVHVGALGENLTTAACEGLPDLDETTVCIGDIFQYGDDKINGEDSVQLRVVQPRRPCYKINDQIGQFAKMSALKESNITYWITQKGLAGWYFKVERQGVICANLPVYLIERPYPFATLDALWTLVNNKGSIDGDVIKLWLDIDCLDKSWKAAVLKKIKH